jgi:VanZ family protein
VISLWLPVVVWMAAIFYGAAIPLTPAPVAGFSDTVMHMGGYAGLAMLALRATAGGRWHGVTARSMGLALLIAVAHGACVEIEQMFVPSRFAEWRDLGNDAIGSAAGLFVVWAWGKLFKE